MEDKLADMIERGGIYRGIKGNCPKDVLSALVLRLAGKLPSAVTGETLLAAVLEREALMSTGVGKGIALPHPRNPIIAEDEKQFAALAFLEQPVNWHSLDGIKVDTLLLIVSSSAKRHLHTLSKINFFCGQEEFRVLLKNCASTEELLGFIREAEKKWTK